MQIGAKVFIFGSISRFGEQIIARARVVSVEKAEIFGVFETSGNQNQIFQMQKRLAQKIATKLAVVATISSSQDISIPKLNLSIYKKLTKFKNFRKQLPLIGLDPTRKQNEVKYYFLLNEINSILSKAPKLAQAHIIRGILYLQLEDTQKCEEDLKIAKQLSPDLLETDFELGNLYYVIKYYGKAEKYWQNYVNKNTEDSSVWYALGKNYIKQNKYENAAKAFIQSCLNYPYLPNAEDNLKVILRSPQSKNVLHRLKSTDFYLLSQLYLNYWNKNFKFVNKIIPSLISKYPNFYLIQYLAGLNAQNEKDYIQALVSYRNCLSLNPKFPDVHREIGKALIKLGDIQTGKKHLNIYLLLADYIDDYEEIEKFLQKR